MDWIARLEEATGRFAAAAEAGDPGARVPHCPDWTLADLVGHLGGVHTWAAHAVTAASPDGDDRPYDGDPAGLLPWYRATARHLVEVLAERPADAPAWAFGPEQVAGFWRRRQVHETTVHLHDALAAQGREEAWEVAADVAWDGVAEVAEVFYPRQVRLGRTAPLPGSLRLTATDVAAEPVLLGDGEEVAELTGPAAYVLLAVWKRAPVEDRAVARLLTAAVTP